MPDFFNSAGDGTGTADVRHSFPDFEDSVSRRRDISGRRELFRRVDFAGCGPSDGSTGDDACPGAEGPPDAAQLAHESGYREGLEAGRREAEARLRPLTEELQKALQEVRDRAAGLYAAAEGQAVELALAVARKIIGRETQIDRQVVVHSLRRALAGLARRSEVTLVLNPEDAVFLKSLTPEALFGEDGAVEKAVFEADPAVAPGGCRVKTAAGDRDATIDGQLARIASAFEEALQQRGGQASPVEENHEG